jgi:hypothetical protein
MKIGEAFAEHMRLVFVVPHSVYTTTPATLLDRWGTRV